jgi:hypothetical protein
VHSLFFLCLVLFFLPVGPPFLIADFGNSVEMFTALRGEFPSLNQKLTGRILFTTNFTAGPTRRSLFVRKEFQTAIPRTAH